MNLAELSKRFQLYAVCVECERMEPLAIDRLLRTLEPDTGLDVVRARVRCSRCGIRTGDIRVVYVGDHDHTAAFHYR